MNHPSSEPQSCEPRLVAPDEWDRSRLNAFLERFFGPAKARFLDNHGAWWHRGDENRLVLAVGEDIAGYCAVIPTRLRVGDDVHEGLWWMDLVVAPEFRGRGLQTLFDLEVRRRSDLLLGFPNELAAKIHRKHGWGVVESLRSMLAPLRPHRLNSVRRADGARGRVIRLGAHLLRPAAAAMRWRALRRSAVQARSVEKPLADDLARIAAQRSDSDASRVEVVRDADFFAWRYLDAPYRDDLKFFVAGPIGAPRAGLIARKLPVEHGGGVRWLELFGDVDNEPIFNDLLDLALRDAIESGATQVTALIADPRLAGSLRRAGLLISTVARFCWSSPNDGLMQAMTQAETAGSLHLGLGDSDNDEPI